MAYSETFNSDLGDWTPFNDVAWDGSNGNPAVGSVNFDHTSPAGGGTIINGSIAGTLAGYSTLNLRWRANITTLGLNILINIQVTTSGGFISDNIPEPGSTGDTGWQSYSLDLGSLAGDTISEVDIITSSQFIGQGDIWVDTITITFDTDPPPTNELRYLGLDADRVNLYVTENDDGVLKLIAYDLATLVQASVAAFGAATYAELNARTRGIFPASPPGNDGVVFARGRDGNNNQVLLSEDYGATFSDVSDAGWATDKYCVGLLPDPLRPDDLVATFGDNDLYQSEDGATTWSKTGDAPATLRAAARHPTMPEELLLGAQAEDTLHFTNNLGASFEDVSDPAVGTVNVVVVSR